MRKGSRAEPSNRGSHLTFRIRIFLICIHVCRKRDEQLTMNEETKLLQWEF